MPTLYLELNAEKLEAGARRADAALANTQRQATELGRALERDAVSNRAYVSSIEATTAAARAMPTVTASVTSATSANTVATLANAAAQRAMALATTVATRAGSALLRTLAITPLVALATAATGVVIELGKMALGFSENTAEAKRYAEQMERAKAATEGFKSSAEQVRQAGLAAERFGEVGDTSGALAARQARLEALKREYQRVAQLDRGTAVTPAFFDQLGVTPPEFSPSQVRSQTGLSSRFAPPTLEYAKQDALVALKKAIDEEAAAIGREEAAQQSATEAGKARLQILEQLTSAYLRLRGVSPEEQAARALGGQAGLSGGYLDAFAKGYASLATALDAAGKAAERAAPALEKANTAAADNAAAKAAGKAGAAEQLLSAIESSEGQVRRATIGADAYGREQAVTNIRALAEEAGFTAEQVARLGEEEGKRYDELGRLNDAQRQASREIEASRERAATTADITGAANSALTGFATNLDQASNIVVQFAADVAASILQQKAIGPAAEAVGGYLGSLFSAKGNAFDSSGVVHHFASGGIVDRRTRFSYGGGRVGEMGEAGPEAIVPLKRTSDGRLGVAMAGGRGGASVTINVSGVRDGAGLRKSARQVAEATGRALERRS